jgi:diguanylate cyclase (GGDEF)-like protein/PAS domain S-box-containing protein
MTDNPAGTQPGSRTTWSVVLICLVLVVAVWLRAFVVGDYVRAAIANAIMLICAGSVLAVLWRQRRTMEALAASETQFRATFDQAAIGIAHASASGRFLRVNRKLCDMLGYTEEELLQRTFLDITHPADAPAAKGRMMQVLAEAGPESSRETEKRYVRKDGGVVWVTLAVALVRDDHGRPQYFVSAIQDVTERKRAEALTGLEHTVARCLAGTDSAADTLKAVMQAICESEHWELGRYWRVDEAAGGLRAIAHWSTPDAAILKYLERSRDLTFAIGVGWAGRAWQTGQPQWVADVSRDARLVQKSIVGETELRAVFAFPVVSEGTTIGVLSFASREIREPDARLLDTASAIGSQVGQFLRSNEAEEGLRRFRAAMDVSADLVLLVDPVNLRYLDANDAACRALGYSHAEIVAMGPTDIFSASRAKLTATYEALIAGDLRDAAVEGVYRCRDGSRIHVESFRRAVPSAQGHVIVSVARDITARKEDEEVLRRFRAAMDATSDAIYLTDRATMRYIDVNETACRMVGRTREELMALGPAGVLGQPVEELARTFDSVIAGGPETAPLELLRPRKDGAQAWVELQRRAQRSADGWMIISVVRDITERKKLEERLLQQANYDNLTQLPNRALCYDRLRQALIQAKRKSVITGVLFVDLDRFKAVNDTHGHGAGDELLREVAKRLTLCVRAGDTVGRLGGDEFLVILPEVAEAKDSALIARKAIDALAEPFRIGEHEVSVSASVGIASYPRDGDTVETLITNADSAMFSAKEAGRNACRFFAGGTSAQD